ncbi:Zinc transporter [[Candida] zeylanoides]
MDGHASEHGLGMGSPEASQQSGLEGAAVAVAAGAPGAPAHRPGAHAHEPGAQHPGAQHSGAAGTGAARHGAAGAGAVRHSAALARKRVAPPPATGAHLVGTLPVLVAFAAMLMSAKLAYVAPAGEAAGEAAGVAASAAAALSVALAAAFLALARCAVRYNVIAASASSAAAPPARRRTAAVVAACAAALTAPHLLAVSRVAPLYLSLYLNPLTPFVLAAFGYDCYCSGGGWPAARVAAAYAAVVASSRVLRTHLGAPRAAARAVARLDVATLTVAFAAAAVAFCAAAAASGARAAAPMLAVHVAASAVFLVSLPDACLRVAPLNPLLMSGIAVALEYAVGGAAPLSAAAAASRALAGVVTVDVADTEDDDAVGGDGASDSVAPPSIVRDILAHADTRAIFNFLLLNTAFMFVQLLYSFRSKSLGLLSDSLHMALDCSSLALGLVAGTLSKAPVDVNGKFPFGLKHFEILAGFTNGTLLIGISGSIVFEAVGRLWRPVVLQRTNELIVVSFLGLLVNLVGIVAFNHGHGGHSHTHGGGGHSHGHSHSHSHSHSHGADGDAGCADADTDAAMNDNMRGIFLHILADTLGSVGVVVSTVLTKVFHSDVFDPLASIVIAVLIFGSALPLVRSTAAQLLLRTGAQRERALRAALRQVTEVKGVKSYTTPRFWPAAAQLTGYIHVQIYRGENSSWVRAQVERVFGAAGIDATVQVENDYDDCWCRSGSEIAVR